MSRGSPMTAMHTSTSSKLCLGTLLYLSVHKIVQGTGQFHINLQSYSFEYDVRKGDADNNMSAKVSRVTFSSEMAYKPQWKLNTGIFQEIQKLDGNNNSNSTTATDDWPWTAKTECSPPSQYRFLICLDYENSYDPENPCSLERVQTDLIQLDRSPFPTTVLGRETISFSSVLTSRDNRNVIRNPFTMDFPSWKGPVRISVYIKCCGELDVFKGQCNEVLVTTLTMTPTSFIQGTQTIWTTLYGRGSLSLGTSATCDPSFYGPSCEIRCQVLNPAQEHAFCNSSTGARQCLKGWSGSDCQEDVDECLEITCQNGGACKNQPGHFTCNCPFGTAGTLCEQRPPLCYLRPCRNQGTCLDTPSGSLCFCGPGYTGQWCDVLETTRSESVTTTPGLIVTHARGGIGRGEANFADIEAGTMQHNNIWKDWYLAIILGMALVFILVVGAIIYRAKAKKRYKINETLNQEPAPEIQTSKSRQFDNAAYQASDPSNIIHSSPIAPSSPIVHSHQPHAFNDKDFHGEYCNLPNGTFRDIDTSGLRPVAHSGGGYHNRGCSDDVGEPLRLENPAFNHGYGTNANMYQEPFAEHGERHGVYDVRTDNLKHPASSAVSSPEFGHNHFNRDLSGNPLQQSTIPTSPKPVAVIVGVKNLDANLVSKKPVPMKGSVDVSNHRVTQNSNVSEYSRSPQISNVPRFGSTFRDSQASDRTESIYEEVNTELTKKPLKPVPFPRSVYKARSETLKRKLCNLNSGAEKPGDNAEHGVYCNVQDVASVRPVPYDDEDGYCVPVIARRKSEGCLADVQSGETSHGEPPSRDEVGVVNPRDTVYVTSSPEMRRPHVCSAQDEHHTPSVTSDRPRVSDVHTMHSAPQSDHILPRSSSDVQAADSVYCNVGQVSLPDHHEHRPPQADEEWGEGETRHQPYYTEDNGGYVNSAAVAHYLKL